MFTFEMELFKCHKPKNLKNWTLKNPPKRHLKEEQVPVLCFWFVWWSWCRILISSSSPVYTILLASNSLTRNHRLRWAFPESNATRCYKSCIRATRRWESIDHYVAGFILSRVQDNHVDLVVFLFRLLSGCWMW